MRLTILAVIATFCVSLGASASSTVKKTGKTPSKSDVSFYLDTYLGFGQTHVDLFATIGIFGGLRWKKLGAALHVPMRLRVKDIGPKSQGGVVRKQDWDEVSDFMRVLPYISWGDPTDALYVRLGELTDFKLGHGTIVSHYFNSPDIDHYQGGLQAHFFHKYGGGELMLDNIIDPNILGARVHIRPLSFFFNNVLKNLEIGFTIVADFQAPVALRQGTDGKVLLNSTNDLQADQKSIAIYGVDISWPIFAKKFLKLTPYADFNFLNNKGAGVHTGMNFALTFGKGISLHSRIEYRYQSKNYEGEYFNTLYEIERYTSLKGTPKQLILTDPARRGRHGFLLSFSMDINRWVRFTAAIDEAQGANNTNLVFRLDLPAWKRFRFSALYIKRNIGAASDLGNARDALAAAELKVSIIGPLYAYGTYALHWHVIDDGTDRGSYQTTHDYSVGLGANFRF